MFSINIDSGLKMDVEDLLRIYKKGAVILKVQKIGGSLYVDLPWKDIESYSITDIGIKRVVYKTPGDLKPTRTKSNRYIKIPKESWICEGEYVLVRRVENYIIVEAPYDDVPLNVNSPIKLLLKVYRRKAAIVKTKLINKSTLYVELPWKEIETYRIKGVGIRRVIYEVPGDRKVAKAGRSRLIVVPKESGIREGEYVLIYREGDKIIVEA